MNGNTGRAASDAAERLAPTQPRARGAQAALDDDAALSQVVELRVDGKCCASSRELNAAHGAAEAGACSGLDGSMEVVHAANGIERHLLAHAVLAVVRDDDEAAVRRRGDRRHVIITLNDTWHLLDTWKHGERMPSGFIEFVGCWCNPFFLVFVCTNSYSTAVCTHCALLGLN